MRNVRQNPSGNRGAVLLWAIGFVMVASLVSYALFVGVQRTLDVSRKSQLEPKMLLTAHSAVNLFKEEMERNLSQFQGNPLGKWTDCHADVSYVPSVNYPERVMWFIGIMQVVASGTWPSSCDDVEVGFQFFRGPPIVGESAPAPPSGPSPSPTLSPGNVTAYTVYFKLVDLVKSELYLPVALNRFRVSLKMTTFDETNGKINGDLILNDDRGSVRHLPLVVDLNRLIGQGSRSPDFCHYCPAIAGGVCCEPVVRTITYMETTGRMMEAKWDPNTYEFTIKPKVAAPPPQPAAITVKDEGLTPLFYENLCNSAFPKHQLRFVIDEMDFQDSLWYQLSSTGDLRYPGSATPAWSQPNPTILSVARYQGSYYFLRSDGAVFYASSIDLISDRREMKKLRLPNAERLTMGNTSTQVCFP